MCTKRYTAIDNDAGRILIIFIEMEIEMEKMGKLFLKIGSSGSTIGSFKADIKAGMGIAI